MFVTISLPNKKKNKLEKSHCFVRCPRDLKGRREGPFFSGAEREKKTTCHLADKEIKKKAVAAVVVSDLIPGKEEDELYVSSAPN